MAGAGAPPKVGTYAIVIEACQGAPDVALRSTFEGSSVVSVTLNEPVPEGDKGLRLRGKDVSSFSPTTISGGCRIATGAPTRTLSCAGPRTGNTGETIAIEAVPAPTACRLAATAC